MTMTINKKTNTASKRNNKMVMETWRRTFMNGLCCGLAGILIGYSMGRSQSSLYSSAGVGASLAAGLDASKHTDNNHDTSSSSTGIISTDTPKNSLTVLHDQVTPEQLSLFDRSRPIYLDFGMSNAADTELYLQRNYSVIAIDAFPHWVQSAKDRFHNEIHKQNRLLVFNVGVGMSDGGMLPLYFIKEGHVESSFEKTKGCSPKLMRGNKEECHEHLVRVVRCEAILSLLGARPQIMKVDIEMLHHSCIRALHRVPTEFLPRYVCWEEHDRPFGDPNLENLRPITDAKLILGLFELGYTTAKIVMQGKVAKYYGLDEKDIGFYQGSGTLSPDDLFHYKSNEYHSDGSFDKDWVMVKQILLEGIYSPSRVKPIPQSTYFDVCMKLSPNPEREQRQKAHNFPLGSYHNEYQSD